MWYLRAPKTYMVWLKYSPVDTYVHRRRRLCGWSTPLWILTCTEDVHGVVEVLLCGYLRAPKTYTVWLKYSSMHTYVHQRRTWCGWSTPLWVLTCTEDVCGVVEVLSVDTYVHRRRTWCGWSTLLWTGTWFCPSAGACLCYFRLCYASSSRRNWLYLRRKTSVVSLETTRRVVTDHERSMKVKCHWLFNVVLILLGAENIAFPLFTRASLLHKTLGINHIITGADPLIQGRTNQEEQAKGVPRKDQPGRPTRKGDPPLIPYTSSSGRRNRDGGELVGMHTIARLSCYFC